MNDPLISTPILAVLDHESLSGISVYISSEKKTNFFFILVWQKRRKIKKKNLKIFSIEYLAIIVPNADISIIFFECGFWIDIEIDIVDTIRLIIVIGQYRFAQNVLFKFVLEIVSIFSKNLRHDTVYRIGSHCLMGYIAIYQNIMSVVLDHRLEAGPQLYLELAQINLKTNN